LGGNLKVNVQRAASQAYSAMWNMLYQLSICSGTEENQ
jgi:hypothetical protein